MSFFIFISCFFYLSSSCEGLRDIKPPIDFKTNFLFFFFILLAIATLALIVGAVIFFSRKKEKKPVEKIEIIKSAHQIAYEALAALKSKNLIAQGKIKEYYYELSDIARHYLENRFSYRAPEMTTEEFLLVLGDSTYLEKRQRSILSEFLIHCDLVKFAKYGPSDQEIEQCFDCARELVEQTKGIAGQEVLK